MFRISRSWWAAILAVLCATAVFAEDRFELTYAKTLTYRSGRITVDHGFGDVKVVVGPDNTFNVRAVIRASDPEFGKQIRITTTEGGDGISVRTDYPEHSTHHGSFSYSVDMRVTVPANAPLTIRNRFG